MAVDPELAVRDMYQVDLQDHDERIALGGWVFYIRGVKRRRQLLHGADDGRGFDYTWVVVMWVWNSVRRMLDRRRAWLLGVVRMGDVATWNDVRPRVVHTEPLGPGESVHQGVARLSAAVREGHFG